MKFACWEVRRQAAGGGQCEVDGGGEDQKMASSERSKFSLSANNL